MTDYGLQAFIYYAGGYHQIAADRIASPQGISYSRGVTDELDLQKGELTFRCWDDDDTYRPTNPESALYGIIGPYLPFLYGVDGAALYAGELETLTPGQTDDHQTTAKITTAGLRWVDFKVSGPLGTVGRWRDVVASPLRTQIIALTTMRAYWPGEDGADAFLMSAAVTGVRAANAVGVTFSAADGPSGSNKLLTIGTGGRLDGQFPAGVNTLAWQLQWTTNLNGADATLRPVFQWTTSNGYSWVWSASTTNYNITVSDDVGSVLFNSTIANGGVGPGRNIVFRLKASKSGATWTFEPGWYAEDAQSFIGTSGTFTGTAGRPVTWTVKENTIMSGAFFGHLLETDGVSENLQTGAMVQAINGFPGESTTLRYRRILGGRGIPLEVLGDESKATLMGPQRPGTVKQQLQEIMTTEFGLIFESPDGRGLRFALRNYLYTQANAPALTLAYPADIGGGFTELGTTLELYNTVIAEDRSGLSATAQEPNGRFGTAIPPDGCGLMDKTVQVNLFNPNDVQQVANTYMRYYQQVTRFGKITIDLDDRPSLRAAAEALDVGQFIKVTGRTPEPQVFMVTRCSGQDLLKRHLISFEHVPGGVFATGTWGDGVHRWDLSASTLSAAATSTATLLPTSTTLNEDWSLSTPYDWIIAGERITVLTITQPSSVAVVDGGFELGIGTWSVTGGTLVQSGAQFHTGSKSALLTVSGSPANALIREHSTVAAAAGQFFYTEMWVRCSVARNVLAVIDFYNGASYITSAITSAPVLANTWTLISTSGTAPATTTRLEFGPTMDASPANGTTLFIDGLEIIRTDVRSTRQLATVARSVNGVVKAQLINAAVHAADGGTWGWG